MNQRIIRVLLSCFLFSSISVSAQMSDKEKFLEALYLMDENRYAAAEPLLEGLYEADKNNANINYSLGISILKSFTEKDKVNALSYLLFASKSVSPNYSYLDPKEKKAPVDTWFYLGKAQHNDYQFIEAIESFNKFKTYVNEKHPLYNEIDKSINMSTYAQNLILNPVNIKTTNLGDKLNGFYPDFSPVVRIDESAVYFTSRRLRDDSSNFEVFEYDGMMYEDIYVSLKEEDGTWGEPYPLNINTDGHEATVNLSIDGRTLYIYKDIGGNGQLFESTLEDDSMGYETWSEPKLLGSDINTKAYETHVTITPDGKTLYFISDREGGLGGKDIYFCRRLPTGKWALSQNAGPILNSDHNEDGVFMHPDGKTMYFSSDGHESMGGYDIMYSTNTDTGWSKPTNMGYPINSVDDDVFFVTTPDGKRAYFSSFKEEGYGEKDVYMLELIDAEETGLTLYRGEFTFVDRYVPPAGAQVTITNNTDGELVGVYTPRQRDGQFSAILMANQSYHFVYEADAYETYEEDIYVSSAGNYQEIYKDIKLRPVRVGDGLETIDPAPFAMANIKGGLMKNGLPMKGMRIELLDESENLLKKTTSDNTGDFEMSELDPSKVYLIRVFSPEGNPLRGYNVEVENDKGEVLPFEPIDDTTYIFIPSVQPYEFYGMSQVKSISGTVKNAGIPVQGLRVKLIDDEQAVIGSEQTDQYGEFNFEKLSLDEEYRIVFEGDFPDDPEIIITNDLGQKMRFIREKKGVYRYVPVTAPMPKALLTDIGGAVTLEGAPIANLQVLLLRADQSLINSAATDNVGKFNFEDLDLTRRYFIRFEGDFPPDVKLVVSNDNFDLLLFRKIQDGLYQYDPVFVRLENAQNEILGKEVTDNVSELNYKKLKLDEYYQIIFEGNFPDMDVITIKNEAGEEFDFKRVRPGVYEYVPKGGLTLKSYTIDVRDELDFKETYPRPEELKDVVAYFQKYFTYNMKDISESNKEFVSFIQDIGELVKLRGDAKIIITSSASKVPTRTWKTNSILTRKRAYDTKALLERVFAKQGIKADQYNFVDINTLITGPEYKGDYVENRSTYEKYQYVRIFIK